MKRPPRAAARLVSFLFGGQGAADAILGDLREDFHRLREARGAAAARRWYWREALGLAAGRLGHGLVRSLGSLSLLRPAGFAEDTAHGARVLWRSPGFTLFVGCVIGLGVAAVTTVFSVLKPLTLGIPFEDAHQLVWISNEGAPGDSSLYAVTSRTANLADFRSRARSFSGITAYDAFFEGRPYTLGGPGEPERLVGAGIADDFLDVLRVTPLLGRGFTPEEARGGAGSAVILSHRLWRDRFASDPGIVGRALTLNGRPRDVVGVLPASFDFSSVFAPGVEVDLLLPLDVRADRGFQGNVLSIIGRLRPGVTAETARAELRALVAALREEEPGRWGLGVRLVSLQEHLAGPFRRSLVLLAAAAGVLLLMVCVNVSGLMLARAPTRAREMAVRRALGAPRSRLVRQLVLETLGISLLGAAIGSLLARFATDVIGRAALIHLPLMESVRVDTTALLVGAGAAVLTGVVVGTLPALQLAGEEASGALASASPRGGASRGARRLREALVVGEIALACALLVVGSLLLTSFRSVLDVDMGFEPEHAVAWPLQPADAPGAPEARAALYQRMAARVELVPGVESVGLVDALPLGRTRQWPRRTVEGSDPGVAAEADVFPHVVSPGYLQAMRIPIVAGRGLARTDGPDARPVILLNETGARRIFGGIEPALGRRIGFWGPWEWEVVGVTRDVRHLSPESDGGIEAYFPLAQMPDYGTMELVVRSAVPAAEIAPAVSQALADIDPGMPTGEFRTLEATVLGTLSGRRFALGLLSAFGAAALLLAALGVYGVLAESVAQRRNELGIRMALGASPPDIVLGVLRRMVALTLGGVAAGWALSLGFSGAVESMLYGVTPADPRAYLGTAVVLVAVATLAAGLPARRAASTEPSRVLDAR